MDNHEIEDKDPVFTRIGRVFPNIGILALFGINHTPDVRPPADNENPETEQLYEVSSDSTVVEVDFKNRKRRAS